MLWVLFVAVSVVIAVIGGQIYYMRRSTIDAVLGLGFFFSGAIAAVAIFGRHTFF